MTSRIILPLILTVASFCFTSCGSVQERKLKLWWEDADFSVNEAVSDIDRLEEHFAGYCELLSDVSLQVASESICSFVDKLKNNELLFYIYYEMFCSALYSIDSPFRNEVLFDVYLDKAMNSGVFKGYEMERINNIASLSKLSRPGEKIPDSEILSLSGESVNLHDFLSSVEQTLMVVVDPNCPYCLEIVDKIENDITVKEMTEDGRLKMLLLSVFPDISTMSRACDNVSSFWNIFVAGHDIDKVIDRSLSPSYYLIGKDAVVRRKASNDFPVF